MMKKLSVFILVFLLTLPAISQIKWGIKAGAETTTVPTYDIATGTSNIEAVEDAEFGWHAGLFMRFKLGPVFIQPEAVFASTSFSYNVKTTATDPGTLMEQKFDRLSIPILVGVKLGPVRFDLGPAASIMIGSPEALIDDPDFEDMYKSSVWGYQAGLGIDLLKRLTFDIRYAGSLGEQFGDAVSIGGQTFKLDYGQSSFLMSVGIMF
jgi:hypothetical protein